MVEELTFLFGELVNEAISDVTAPGCCGTFYIDAILLLKWKFSYICFKHSFDNYCN